MSWLKSELQFRRYEPYIRTALTNTTGHPTLVSSPYTKPSTIAVQLRGAILGWKENEWPITWEPLYPLHQLTVVETSENTFLSVSKTSKHQQPPSPTLISQTPVLLQGLTLTPDELRAFCFLVNNQKIKGPITFTHEGPVDSELEILYDVAITPISANTYRLL